uniref:NADH-ubiquinone oxidoreductase chain 2 n=1 Tax=Cyclorhipidion bodoanum TaxID=2566501 RepID=A0A343A6N6_9CUCU|nr:NADH dehydrogenase subunit 2 [Cyclorhipidion bodoanus]AOY40241.1 NADH dehydrogenase subunit 2 [Cyclorhipidion bodoanus]
MFFTVLVLGTLMSISSMSWMCAWIGLEINMLSFITLMKSPNNKYSSESISKYFMTQAMASFILLFSIIMYSNSKSFNYTLNNFSSSMMSMSIFMKMGASPLHFWFPEVASGISWDSNLILLTIQKIAPMILLSYMKMMPSLMILFILSSSIVGSLLGLNQMCLRKILAYSSINHMSWMLSSMLCSMSTWLIYFFTYSIMNLVIINTLKSWKIYTLPQMNNIKHSTNKTIFMLNFFSLGGLPPFLGFLPKWITINQLSNSSFFFLSTLLISFTLITLFFYLRMSFSSLTLYSSNPFIKKFNNKLLMSMITLTAMPVWISTSLLIL